MARCQLRVRRDPSYLFSAFEDTLSALIPAIVELALVLVGPGFGNMMWAVNGSTSPIHEEWLFRPERLMLVQPIDGVIGEIFAQMVSLL